MLLIFIIRKKLIFMNYIFLSTFGLSLAILISLPFIKDEKNGIHFFKRCKFAFY